MTISSIKSSSNLISTNSSLYHEEDKEEYIEYKCKGLKEIPEPTHKYSITKINVPFNDIKKFPIWIKSCPLKNIDVQGNEIQEIDALADVKNLEFATLSNNQISSIKQIFFISLQNLIFLDLSSNQLTSLSGIENLKNLIHLSAAANIIS